MDLTLERVDDLLLRFGDVLDLGGLLAVGHGERALQRIDLRPELGGAIERWPPRKLVDLPLEHVDDLLLRLGDVVDLGGLLVVGRGEHALQLADFRSELSDSFGRGSSRELADPPAILVEDLLVSTGEHVDLFLQLGDDHLLLLDGPPLPTTFRLAARPAAAPPIGLPRIPCTKWGSMVGFQHLSGLSKGDRDTRSLTLTPCASVPRRFPASSSPLGSARGREARLRLSPGPWRLLP